MRAAVGTTYLVTRVASIEEPHVLSVTAAGVDAF